MPRPPLSASSPAPRQGRRRHRGDERGRYPRGVPIMARLVGGLVRAVKWVQRNPAVMAGSDAGADGRHGSCSASSPRRHDQAKSARYETLRANTMRHALQLDLALRACRDSRWSHGPTRFSPRDCASVPAHLGDTSCPLDLPPDSLTPARTRQRRDQRGDQPGRQTHRQVQLRQCGQGMGLLARGRYCSPLGDTEAMCSVWRSALRWQPHRRRLGTGDGPVKVWNAETGQGEAPRGTYRTWREERSDQPRRHAESLAVAMTRW